LKVYSKVVEVRTYGPMELHPITSILKETLHESDIKNGIVWISVEGATPALCLLRRGIEKRFLSYIARLIPFTGWNHGNAYAHLISTLVSTNKAIPIINGELLLNPDEEVYVLETRSVYNHVRKIAIEIHGN